MAYIFSHQGFYRSFNNGVNIKFDGRVVETESRKLQKFCIGGYNFSKMVTFTFHVKLLCVNAFFQKAERALACFFFLRQIVIRYNLLILQES